MGSVNGDFCAENTGSSKKCTAGESGSQSKAEQRYCVLRPFTKACQRHGHHRFLEDSGSESEFLGGC
jgi:hypothetical protein